MATSGTSALTSTRNQLIRQAALLIQAVGAGMTMNATSAQDFAFNLNAMVKSWQARGIHIWTVDEMTLFPQPGQVKYMLGTGTTDHATRTFYSTALSADEAAGQTTLSIDSNDDMTNGDKIGIVLDDGTLHWTTIVSSTSTTVTITDALTDSASEDAIVYFYTTNMVRPLKVVDGRRYNIAAASDTPVMRYSRMDYQAIPNKAQAGNINGFWYDRQLANGYLYLWQVPEATTELLKATVHRPIETFEAAGDNPDLPEEWIKCIYYNLAVVMAPQYDVPMAKYNMLNSKAEEYLDEMTGYDREDESYFIQPAQEY